MGLRAKRFVVQMIMLAAMVAVPLQSWAVPAKPVRRSVTMADGTKVEATLQGDEHLHFFRQDDGRLLLPQQDGLYRLASEQEVNSIWTERMAEARKRQTERKENTHGADLWNASASTLRRNAAKAGNVYQGKKRGLVILINFMDLRMSVESPQQTYNDYFNKEGYNENGMTGSVHDYFYSQSYGQLDLSFDVYGPVTLSKSYSYYGADEGTSIDVNVSSMVVEACRMLNASVDFSKYDWDGDGVVDQVFFVYAGYGQNYGAPASTIWPHESSIINYGLTLDGVSIGTYACGSELQGKSGSVMAGIGTACHEFSHCMGIMDHYDTEASTNYGMGSWDVMCSGSYNNSGRTPAGYTAYERWMSGWLEPVEINKATSVTGMKALTDSPEAYLIRNDYNANEYYMLENRQQQGWDASLAGHGLLIYHVDYDATVWRYNKVNVDPDRQRMAVIPADGLASDGSESGDPWPGASGKKALTDISSPAAIVYTAGPDGYAFMKKPVTDIAEDEARGQISFSCMVGTLVTPVLSAVTGITDNSFTIGWSAVEGATQYEVSLKEKPTSYADPEDGLLLKEDFSKCLTKSTSLNSIATKLDQYTSAPGWTGNNLYTSSHYLKMGQGSKMGVITSPETKSPATEQLTIVLTIEPYNASTPLSGKFKIYKKSTTLTANIQKVTEKQNFLFHAENINTPFKVSFEPAQMGYISYLAVYDGDYTAEQLGMTVDDDGDDTKNVMADTQSVSSAKRKAAEAVTFTTSDLQYTFTGLTSTSDYYVTVRALNDTESSKWSKETKVTLDQTPVTAPVEADVQSDAPWYDLQGRKLQGMPGRGLYIHGHRKVVVR